MIANLPQILRPQVDYDDLLTQQRAQSLLLFLGVTFALSIILALIFGVTYIQGAFSSGEPPTIAQVIVMLSPLISGIFLYLVRAGYYRVGAWGFVIAALAYLFVFQNGSVNDLRVIMFAMPIIASSLLLGWRATLLTFAIAVIFAVNPTLLNGAEPVYQDFAYLVAILFVITLMVIFFGSNLQNTAGHLANQLSSLQNVINATLITGRDRNENEAAMNTINVIRDQPGYTFARIYLVEAGEVTQRIQSGLNLSQINVDTEVNLGTRSGIHEAIRNRATFVIRETDEPILRQHLLTGTSAALAVPVFNHEKYIIAVLDIQSEDKSDFSSTEIKTLELIASRFGQSLEQIRTVAELRHDLLEQDDLLTRQRQRLLQYERAERQVTTETWRDYLQQHGVDYLGYDIAELMADPVESTDLTDEIQAAIQTGDITVEQDGDHQLVSVPISLRGQTLGAMSFRVASGTQVIGARQQELIRNVVQRLSLALENKRLFEQSQSQAKRESKANEVGNLLLSSTDINTVLNLAAENFNEALGAIQTQIRLQPDLQEIGEGESLS